MKKGLTLVELMIVVGVITFLALLITSYLRTQVFKGYDARRKAEIKRIAIAAEEYEKDNNCYPISSLLACHPGTGLLPYIDKVPCDPVTKASYMYEHEDSVCPRWFKIYTDLDNESDPDYNAYIGPNGAFNFVYESTSAPVTVSQGGGTEEGGTEGGGATQIPQTNYYGCFSGSCLPISWDPTRPGTECDPNFQNSTCYGACIDANTGQTQNECEPWN